MNPSTARAVIESEADMATAFTEHLTSLLRIGKDGAKYGDDFELSVVIRWIDPQNVELVGMSTLRKQTQGKRKKAKCFNLEHHRAIRAELTRLGIKTAHWVRRKDEQIRHRAQAHAKE